MGFKSELRHKMFRGLRFAEHSADVTRAVCIIFEAVSITGGETWLFSIKGSVWRDEESNVFLGPIHEKQLLLAAFPGILPPFSSSASPANPARFLPRIIARNH